MNNSQDVSTMFIDSHCHLDMLEANTGQQGVENFVSAAHTAGVERMLTVAVDTASIASIEALINRFPTVYGAIGLHPNHADEPCDAGYFQLARTHPRVIAIGETGLDFYRDHVDPARQEQVFRQHIAVSRELGKPLIVHIREAYSEVIAVLREEQAGQTGGIIHCYTGDWESARQLLDQGFYVGFSGISTFKSADTIREVIARMPEDKILIETDSPFLAPVPFRGKQNQPAYVVKVAEAIAKVRGLTVEAVADLTTANFKRLFPTVG